MTERMENRLLTGDILSDRKNGYIFLVVNVLYKNEFPQIRLYSLKGQKLETSNFDVIDISEFLVRDGRIWVTDDEELGFIKLSNSRILGVK